MRIYYLTHASYEGLGAIETWLKHNNFSTQGTRVDAGEPLPNLDEFDFLIVMGGPQSVANLAAYPYLIPEIELVRKAVHANKMVLGICLGAQILAAAMGAAVKPNQYKEIGVHPILFNLAGITDPIFAEFENPLSVLHWHGDTFEIPAEGILLASSVACAHQAFRVGKKAYGLQFHLDFTKESVEAILHHEAGLPSGPYISSAEQLLATDFATMHQQLFTILNRMITLANDASSNAIKRSGFSWTQ